MNAPKIVTVCFGAVTVAILLMCGCENRPKTYVDKNQTIFVDTINIHGHSHEILLRSDNYANAVGGIMHSPECWCGKGGGR